MSSAYVAKAQGTMQKALGKTTGGKAAGMKPAPKMAPAPVKLAKAAKGVPSLDTASKTAGGRALSSIKARDKAGMSAKFDALHPRDRKGRFADK